MKYLKIFCLVFTTLFLIGFWLGWDDCNEKVDDYLIQKIHIAVSNGADSPQKVYLCYVKGRDTLLRYSVDSNKFISKNDWVVKNSLNLGSTNAKIPMIAKYGNIKFLAFGVLGTQAGKYLWKNAPKSPSELVKLLGDIDKNTGVATKSGLAVKYTLLSIVGAVTGIVSGYAIAERVFEPSENTDAVIKRMNDLSFWAIAETKLWYAYAERLKAQYLNAGVGRSIYTAQQLKAYSAINQTESALLADVEMKRRGINSADFFTLYNYQRTIDASTGLRKLTLVSTKPQTNWVDYLMYAFAAIVLTVTLVFFTLWLLMVFKVSNAYNNL